MDQTRRKFIVKLGSATLFGIGCAVSLDKLVSSDAAAKPTGPEQGEGTRWGMFVDMAKCDAECTDCITACHTKHNVPDFGNPKDEVKWLYKLKNEQAFPSQSHEFQAEQVAQKPVPTLCNHCADPPCVKVCPTGATFTRPDGIVDMDFHRCIGCRFCMAGCPYGARSFNWRDPRPFIGKLDYSYPTREIGVVEKCNFCSERIDRGQQPACVVSCQSKALVFGNLKDKDSEIRQVLRKRHTYQRKPELGARPSVFYAFGESHD